MRGIILAGGSGTRLHPVTLGVSKQLVPVYDKPMIYYPLSTLIFAGIRDVLVITTPHEAASSSGCWATAASSASPISYAQQPSPDGLAQAFVIGADFIGEEKVALVLGDNIFYGNGLGSQLQSFADVDGGAVFAYWVADPSAYGVVEFDAERAGDLARGEAGRARRTTPCPGLYFYDNDVVEIAARPEALGPRGVRDHRHQPAYLARRPPEGRRAAPGHGLVGHRDVRSLNDANNFVRTLEARQGLKVGSPEEAAWRQGFLTDTELRDRATALAKSGYGTYLLEMLRHAQPND